MLAILYSLAATGFSSTFTFTNFAFPLSSSDTSSITGESILHGPHHVAQKSTTTGTSEFVTSLWKFMSFITFTILLPPYTPGGYFIIVF